MDSLSGLGSQIDKPALARDSQRVQNEKGVVPALVSLVELCTHLRYKKTNLSH